MKLCSKQIYSVIFICVWRIIMSEAFFIKEVSAARMQDICDGQGNEKFRFIVTFIFILVHLKYDDCGR